jgi:opacity protein-like surface antigen
MKRMIAALAMTMALSGAAHAADAVDPMASRIGNTVTLTAADGKVTKVMYNAGGTMDMVAPDATKGTGKWAVKEGKLCVTLDAGPTAGKENCNPFADHKIGDTWQVPLADGTTSTATLVAGR